MLKQHAKKIMPSRSTKIFCVGFNKTGTTSLHKFFTDARLRSEHKTTWPFYSETLEKDARSYFRRAQCYSDGELANFVRLDELFPSAIFILNTREERAWLRSRIKHVLRFGAPSSSDQIERDQRYGRMARTFFTDEKKAITSWVYERRIYEERARRYFSSSPRFIELSVTDDADWKNRLTSHLISHKVLNVGFEPTMNIHANKRETKDVNAKEALSNYFDLADRILGEVNAEGTARLSDQ